MTDPGRLAPQFEALPSEVSALGRIAQGLLVHSDWLPAYGIDPAAIANISRATLPVSERLSAIVEADGLPLVEGRPATRRSIGTCRDFALTLTSFLRATGTPARIRCGFAAYLGEGWEDHWICEYWNPNKSEWRRSDPQLDDVTRTACNVAFDPSDMPGEMFLTAGEAWLRCRAGRDSAERFGQGGLKGAWFMKVNLIRDNYAVNNHETSAWDRWREAPAELRVVNAEELIKLDDLANQPDAFAADFRPSWLGV